ncbi:bifunctional adenosylcobinamide kinase/adenosylcobinamide-phosphate guanylyltransferase [Pseudonocardiaceae bacterium YIM PH 21723]|nr:bifunctional adenosylcobinamide kinase/adenosylcobinamide-phosphate guanylyltransferase [Pseudonocardiaceae bacterium YIM PH 21723]
MAMRTLVLGGARSGKSAHAEHLLPADAPVSYVATARRDPMDPEWEKRIETHIRRRPSTWRTIEAPASAEILGVLARAYANELILIDDIATWLTGLLDDAGAWDGNEHAIFTAHRYCAALVEAVLRCPARIVLVSTEVGLGVVPESASGRLFRDELGRLNAQLAQVCDEVLLLVAGIPLRLR